MIGEVAQTAVGGRITCVIHVFLRNHTWRGYNQNFHTFRVQVIILTAGAQSARDRMTCVIHVFLHCNSSRVWQVGALLGM